MTSTNSSSQRVPKGAHGPPSVATRSAHEAFSKPLQAAAFIAELALAIYVVFIQAVSQMNLGNCRPGKCDYSYSTFAYYLMPTVASIIVVASGVLCLFFREPGCFIPLSGVLAIIAVLGVTQILLARTLAG